MKPHSYAHLHLPNVHFCDTPGAKTIKKNTNSTQNKSETHLAKQYEVTSFLSTDCELSTETCSKNVYSLGPRIMHLILKVKFLHSCQCINHEFVYRPFQCIFNRWYTSGAFRNCNEGLFLHWAGGLQPLMPVATVKVIALSFTAPSWNSSFQPMVMLNINLLSKHLVVLCGESASNWVINNRSWGWLCQLTPADGCNQKTPLWCHRLGVHRQH